MRRLRSLATFLIVCTTATSTLLGGLPHFVCRCPDGSIKHFCFGETSSCCMGQSPCAQRGNQGPQKKLASNQRGPKPSCCTSAKKATVLTRSHSATKPGAGPVLQSAGCQRILEQSEAQPAPGKSADTDEIRIAAHDILLLVNVPNPAPSAAPPRGIWQVHGLPPPIDFVTTLHRLVI